MSNIIQFNDKTKSEKVGADEVLEQSKGKGLTDVLVIGYQDDVAYVATSMHDIKEILFAIEEFKFRLLSGDLNEE